MGLGAGQIADDGDFTTIAESSSQRPIGRLVASGTQALADNTQVAIQYSTEDWDTHGFHSTVTNNSRVTPNVSGYYRVWVTTFFDLQTTPVVSDTNVRKNGSSNLAPASRGVGQTVAFSQDCTVEVEMNGTTDYFEHVARQDSAGADSTNQSSQFSSVMEWAKTRDLA